MWTEFTIMVLLYIVCNFSVLVELSLKTKQSTYKPFCGVNMKNDLNIQKSWNTSRGCTDNEFPCFNWKEMFQILISRCLSPFYWWIVFLVNWFAVNVHATGRNLYLNKNSPCPTGAEQTAGSRIVGSLGWKPEWI
jgi:hypothetical protein